VASARQWCYPLATVIFQVLSLQLVLVTIFVITQGAMFWQPFAPLLMPIGQRVPGLLTS